MPTSVTFHPIEPHIYNIGAVAVNICDIDH